MATGAGTSVQFILPAWPDGTTVIAVPLTTLR